MMNFTLNTIRKLVDQALATADAVPTGDAFLDARYQEQVGIIGHTNPYYRLFYSIARELQPALSVELGSWQATAAAHLASAWPAGQVITIDIHKDDKAAQQRTIEAATHYGNLTYINDWTWNAASRVPAGIDILFIDSWHEYEYARRDWAIYQPLLSSPALVICDDIFDSELFIGMERFWQELPGEKFTNGGVHPGIPMGFIRYVAPNREPDQPKRPAAARRVAGKSTRKS